MADHHPGSGLLILPDVSHFAFLQDPGEFDANLLNFPAHVRGGLTAGTRPLAGSRANVELRPVRRAELAYRLPSGPESEAPPSKAVSKTNAQAGVINSMPRERASTAQPRKTGHDSDSIGINRESHDGTKRRRERRGGFAGTDSPGRGSFV